MTIFISIQKNIFRLFRYELSDGQSRTEKGTLKDVKDADGKDIKILSVTGQYSFVAPSGQKFITFYTADEVIKSYLLLSSNVLMPSYYFRIFTERLSCREDDEHCCKCRSIKNGARCQERRNCNNHRNSIRVRLVKNVNLILLGTSCHKPQKTSFFVPRPFIHSSTTEAVHPSFFSCSFVI